MKTLCVVAIISLLIGIAVAQEPNRQENESKSPPQAGAQTQSGTSAQKGGVGIGNGQTRSYKGTLVDASCTAGGTAPSPAVVSDSTQQAPDTTKSKQKDEASRSATPETSGQTCSISSNTSQFALKLEDGRTVRFDSVGNLRAQEAIKNKKKWTEAAGSGKPILAKVNGLMIDDKLMVISIN